MSQTQAMQTLAQSVVLSKEAQTRMADELVAQVTEGNVDPIQAFVQVKALLETADQFLKNPEIVAAVQSAAEERGKMAVFAGTKVGVSYTTRYDYSMCGDSEYDALIKEKENLDAKIKARQMFLKSVPDKVEVVDHETGALVTICAPLPTKSSSLRVTFAKQ